MTIAVCRIEKAATWRVQGVAWRCWVQRCSKKRDGGRGGGELYLCTQEGGGNDLGEGGGGMVLGRGMARSGYSGCYPTTFT